MSRHAERGHQYALNVVAGAIPACRWVRLACQRHVDDLARQATPAFPYRFDPERAAKVCRFVERLRHIKGPLAGRTIELADWQCWILTEVYGWLCDGGPREGKRRFRRVYLEMPRGQGKSALSSGVGLYALSADSEGGAEVYSLATTRAQAGIVFRDAQQMARKSPDLMRALGVDVAAHGIRVQRTGSKFEALSSEGGTLDGLNVHLGIIDELHAHKTRDVYDVIETAIGKRDQSLLWCITTAGTNRAGICYELRTYLTKVLGGVPDEAMFGVIYTIDDGDDWTAEAAWKKANPNYGISVQPEIIGQLCAKAMQMPAARNNFLTKHLCVWTNADTAWMDMRAWDRARDPTLDVADFEGQACTIGLDLATRSDLCAKVRIFPRDLDGITHYYAFGHYYLPETAISDGRNSQYSGWEFEGRLTATPGDVTDFETIEDDLFDDCSRYTVTEIAYDPWQATQLAQRLQARGADVIEYRNTVANFSAPMKELDALVRQGRFHHDGDPILTWCVSNVVCHVDAKDNIYPRKDRPENKIDAVVATLSALGRLLVSIQSGTSFYETGDLMFV